MSIESVLAGERRWTVVTGNCSDVLASLADDSIDVCITDPPYDEHTQANIRSVYSDGAERVKKWDLDFAHLSSFEFVPELLRVTKRWVVCFCALEQLADYKRAAGDCWIRSGIWHKTMAAPQISGDRPANSCEGVAIMHRAGKKRWNGGGTHAFWRSNPVRDDRLHPCQKPRVIAKRMVELFSDPNEVALDPFCGSGAFGVAAVQTGRRYVGVDLNETYSEIARQAIANETRGLNYSDTRAGQLGLLDAIGESNERVR